MATRTTQLLVIDPQNDFCDLPQAWLPVDPVTGGLLQPALPVAGKHYHRCRSCELVWLDEADHLDDAAEKAVYDGHDNQVDDPRYRGFLMRAFGEVLSRVSPPASGLDFGCGPGPALIAMGREAGFEMAGYDKFYADEPELLTRRYDFITSTEVIERPDLAADEPLPAVYDGVWVEAVQRFQERHGLEVDGVLGKDTWAALRVTPGERAQQIALNLERLRWTPLTEAPRMIVVNIPEFVLRAYEVREGRIVVHHTMKIIVGKAMDTRTPVFEEEMRSIEFSPYWNVPPDLVQHTIANNVLDRGLRYLKQNTYEVLSDFTDNPAALDPAKVNWRAVAQGAIAPPRVRQKPGGPNFMGKVKFEFPNAQGIYLHDTPERALLKLDDRQLSNGCVRLEDADRFGKWLLGKSLPTSKSPEQRVDLPQHIIGLRFHAGVKVFCHLSGGVNHAVFGDLDGCCVASF